MRRMVVSTGRGEFITEMDVEEHELVDSLSAWLRVLPDAGIYLDGQLVPEEARMAMRHAMSSGTASPLSRPVPPPEPERLRDYAETLQRAFDDVRQGYVQSLRDFQDCARRFSEMWIERERQFADEAARQRELTHKSLADVDLLGRSVKAVQLDEVLAMSSVHTSAMARRDHGVALMDYVGGFLKALTGEK